MQVIQLLHAAAISFVQIQLTSLMLPQSQAFDSPLPTSWTEYVDADGRVYFSNQAFCTLVN